MRVPPAGSADTDAWDTFNEWADAHYIGVSLDDWEPWWECYLSGYTAGLIGGVSSDES